MDRPIEASNFVTALRFTVSVVIDGLRLAIKIRDSRLRSSNFVPLPRTADIVRHTYLFNSVKTSATCP
eukprot:7271739-Pyramimonas_sp.AAC.1